MLSREGRPSEVPCRFQLQRQLWRRQSLAQLFLAHGCLSQSCYLDMKDAHKRFCAHSLFSPEAFVPKPPSIALILMLWGVTIGLMYKC